MRYITTQVSLKRKEHERYRDKTNIPFSST